MNRLWQWILNNILIWPMWLVRVAWIYFLATLAVLLQTFTKIVEAILRIIRAR